MVNEMSLQSNCFGGGRFQSVTTSFCKPAKSKANHKGISMDSKCSKLYISAFDIDDSDDDSYVL